MTTNVPTYSKNLYSKKALLASNEVFKELRDLGEVVYLSKHKLYAVTRYDGVKKALRANKVLICGKGVAANKMANGIGEHTVLMSDGDTHKKRRGVLMRPLSLPKMMEIKDAVATTADELIKDLMKKEKFEVVQDFGSHLPLTIVSNMVGLDENAKRKMLVWAAASFNTLSVMNFRAIKNIPKMALGLAKYADKLSEDQVQPGGWAAKVFQAVKDGTLNVDEGKGMILDYVVPSLDTTILAASHMFWQLAKNPTAFNEVKKDPSLIPNVVNEAVRLSTPIRAFTRYAEEDFDINGSVIPKGGRALILYASANRDKRHYENPDTFDIHRNNRDHLGWGHGVHSCADSHLARLELTELLNALCRHANAIKVGKTTMIVNNILQGYDTIEGSLS